MIVYVDNEQCIRAVNTTNDETLRPLEINDIGNPFSDWSTAKICSYRCIVDNGEVSMYTPYRDSRSLDFIDEIGHKVDEYQDKADAFDILIGEVEA